MNYWNKKQKLDTFLEQLDLETVEANMPELQEVTGFHGIRNQEGDFYDPLGVLVDLGDVYHGDKIDRIIETVERILKRP